MYRPAPQAQILLLPPAIGDLIPEKDLCRVIHRFIDALPRCAVEDKFPHTVGAPPFHPRLMLKILLYAYAQGLRSSRKIARACTRDIAFLWLACLEKPSHHTVNRFRSEYFADALPAVLAEMAEMLLKKKYIRSEEYFVDGTILEANANKNTHVWRKNAARYKQHVQERAREILVEAAQADAEEDARLGGRDLPEMGDGMELDAAEIRAAAQKLSVSGDAQQRKSAAELTKEAVKMEKDEAQEKTLGARNSYSKTDSDATFLRTKDDLLRPAYNAQAGVQDGYITGASVGQNANDASELIPHLESRRAAGLPDPPAVVADSIYGTEENYAHLEQHSVVSYLKYPSWHREQSGHLKPYEKASFARDEERDRFVCPRGKVLEFTEEQQQTTKSGYVKTLRFYECRDCTTCPVKSDCTQSAGNRRIQHSLELARQQAATRERLLTPEGATLCKKRGWQIETVWAHFKRNLGFRRFSVRGLEKVRAEMHWMSLGYNLRRLTNAASA